MNFESFYTLCQQLPEKDRQWVDVFYKTVIEVFDEEHPQFQNPDRICKLFYGKSASISKAQYYRKRNLVRMFYDWLYQQGAIDKQVVEDVYSLQLKDVVTDYELSHYYFKDLDDALGFVTKVGAVKGLNEPNDMLNFKVIVILTWYGAELQELLSIKKSNLDRVNCTVTVGDKVLHLTTEYMNILCRFADIDLHKGFPSQKQQIYVTSQYLMRSSKQSCMSPNNVQCAIRRFNTIAADYDHEISVLNLRKNGVFRRVYDSSDDKTVNTLIQEITGCDTAFAVGYKEFYERWKRYAIGDDES